ncbi:hypothetical protein BKN38_00405 [Helicobacter sp. CLO-3]|nr:hypothetical protein BKN38_00405 [Helicobacter sp. CLO-3]
MRNVQKCKYTWVLYMRIAAPLACAIQNKVYLKASDDALEKNKKNQKYALLINYDFLLIMFHCNDNFIYLYIFWRAILQNLARIRLALTYSQIFCRSQIFHHIANAPPQRLHHKHFPILQIPPRCLHHKRA